MSHTACALCRYSVPRAHWHKALDFGLPKALEPAGIAQDFSPANVTHSPTLSMMATKSGFGGETMAGILRTPCICAATSFGYHCTEFGDGLREPAWRPFDPCAAIIRVLQRWGCRMGPQRQ